MKKFATSWETPGDIREPGGEKPGSFRVIESRRLRSTTVRLWAVLSGVSPPLNATPLTPAIRASGPAQLPDALKLMDRGTKAVWERVSSRKVNNTRHATTASPNATSITYRP